MQKVRSTRRISGLLKALWVVTLASLLVLGAACGGGDKKSDDDDGGSDTTETTESKPKADGAKVYVDAGCNGCHGANGEGGTGPAFKNTATVFPDEADQIDWVSEKAAATSGPYGANNSGNNGQGSTVGAMPAFKDTLSKDEIAAVVQYERDVLAKK